jgi:hypothetical protein
MNEIIQSFLHFLGICLISGAVCLGVFIYVTWRAVKQ